MRTCRPGGGPYTIDTSGVTNGTITAEVSGGATTTVNVKDTVTLTITPSTNYTYKPDSLKVNNGTVTVKSSVAATCAFTMPEENVTVTAVMTAAIAATVAPKTAALAMTRPFPLHIP
jgi:hypothetical protein